ncbi:MAG: molybdopterin dinucleotide binding domain-containing protein, partial [Aquificaceae bacterium]
MGYLCHGLPGYRDVRSASDRTFMEVFWGIERGSIKDAPGPTITEALELMLEGRIKLLWVVCTNPALTLPNLNKVWRALERVFLVVQDAYWTRTCELANLVLPAAQMGEKQGVMTGSDRTISLCEKFSEPPGEAKPDWLIFRELAHRLGYGRAFDYENTQDIFEELKEATRGRLCDYSALSYENLPARWGRRWLYEDFDFPTESKRARMHPTPYFHQTASVILLTGRTKNQWHTMTRTGKSPELLKGEENPFLLLHPEDARELGVEEEEFVFIHSPWGSVGLKVKYGDIKVGHAFAPFGYGSAPVNLLTGDGIDPFSKEPELKFTPVLLAGTKEAVSHGSER